MHEEPHAFWEAGGRANQGTEDIAKFAVTSTAVEQLGATEIGALAVARVYEHDDPEWGFDARSATYANMVERGVIDPLK